MMYLASKGQVDPLLTGILQFCYCQNMLLC